MKRHNFCRLEDAASVEAQQQHYFAQSEKRAWWLSGALIDRLQFAASLWVIAFHKHREKKSAMYKSTNYSNLSLHVVFSTSLALQLVFLLFYPYFPLSFHSVLLSDNWRNLDKAKHLNSILDNEKFKSHLDF